MLEFPVQTSNLLATAVSGAVSAMNACLNITGEQGLLPQFR